MCFALSFVSTGVVVFSKGKRRRSSQLQDTNDFPPASTFGLLPRFCSVGIKMAKPFVESWVNFIMKRDGI